MKNHALGSIAHPTGWLIPTLPSHDSFTIGGRRRVPVVWMSSAPSVDDAYGYFEWTPSSTTNRLRARKKGGTVRDFRCRQRCNHGALPSTSLQLQDL